MSNNKIFLIAQREITDLIKDWRLSLPGIFFALLIPSAIFLAIRFLTSYSDLTTQQISLETFYPISILVVVFFPSALTVVVALETFVGERERQTLEVLLLTPVKDKEIYIAKVIASIFPPFVLGLVSLSIYTLESKLFLKHFVSGEMLILIVSLCFVKSLLLVTGSAVISSQSKTIRAANLTSTAIVFPTTLLLGLESHLLMYKQITALKFLLFIILIYVILFIKIGIKIFNRENLLLFEQQTGSLKDALLIFFNKLKSALLSRDEPTASKNFLKDIFILIYENKFKVVFMTAFLIAGFFIGFYFASSLIKEVPQMIIKENETVKNINLLPEFTPFKIAKHNLRAMLVILFLSPFTFGVSAVFFAIIPGAIVGFLIGLTPHPSIYFIFSQLKYLIPHGIFEIPAMLIAAVFIFNFGTVLLAESKGHLWFDRFIQAFANLLKILILIIPLFLIASYLEVYVRIK